MAEPLALTALALDAALGWPTAFYRRIGHPVGLFARVITACERRWNRPDRSARTRRLLGIVTLALLILGTGGAALAAERSLLASFGAVGWLAVALLAWPALAQRSLYDHVEAVARPLIAGDIATARGAVGAIVGRDTATLDESGIARAAIESLAESFCDGVAAPLFWLLIGGLPGVWIYKAVNTADSLIGHREPRWRAFGWAAARVDDAMNLIPARLCAVLIAIAGHGGWRVMMRDARQHASPNAGWPEAAMAGALDVRLAGPLSYDGVAMAKPWIGGEGRDARPGDIRRALRLYGRACLLLWLIAGGAVWLLP
ncbi:MAG: adenosylcobinamide-phosphate synthase CbiB [Sphingopyxis sp.]|uniref:adenosylcobinamide-phosphate synthase CbiB n=1 Tax=Sphingopyxis sp. TaxID=1908224 RepID=UPI002ABD0314|nr:adenosylcobinamide-phosphate synthase CbiB [Sphingopyxis sp.]MDZ3831475.1 adenosylcobinamide-phosphate synthase CbiB [Sphingopyxis sp.]